MDNMETMMPLQQHQHQAHHISKINELQRKQLKNLLNACIFYDAVIIVDRVRFPVDRNIISCCSPYFRALFTNASMKNKLRPSSEVESAFPCEIDAGKNHLRHRNTSEESESMDVVPGVNQSHSRELCFDPRDITPPRSVRSRVCTEIFVSDVRPEVMSDIIDHAYGVDVNITENNCEALLIAADMFHITSLLAKCCAFLESQLCAENCIAIVRFVSRFLQCQQLRRKATQFFLGHFVSVSKKSPDFLTLSIEELEAVLKADRLNIRHEVDVLNAISRWVVENAQIRSEHIPRLVRCVRLGLISPGEVESLVNSWPQPSSPVVLQVMVAVLEQHRHQLEHLDNFVFSPRIPRDILLLVGGSDFGYPLNLIEAFDCRTWNWSVVEPGDFAPRSYHGMVSVDNEIYIIGGFSGQEYLSNCCKFKPESLEWEHVTPMNTKRCYVGVAVLKGSIYAVGGFDGVQRLQSAEKFNKVRNQWTLVSPMLQQRSDAGVVNFRDKLYVCGGFNGVACTHAVETYDPVSDQWSALAAMSCPRSGPGVVTYRDCIYVLGGFDGEDNTVRLATMEVYYPDIDQWQPGKPMTSPRSNMAVEVLEGVLFAVGGYNGERTTAVVEGFHFSSNTWQEYPALNHKRSALSVCKVQGLSNTEELLGRNIQR